VTGCCGGLRAQGGGRLGACERGLERHWLRRRRRGRNRRFVDGGHRSVALAGGRLGLRLRGQEAGVGIVDRLAVYWSTLACVVTASAGDGGVRGRSHLEWQRGLAAGVEVRRIDVAAARLLGRGYALLLPVGVFRDRRCGSGSGERQHAACERGLHAPGDHGLG
jgi:hypothetical protein